MHEVTEATASALSHFILATAGFSEVSYGGKLCLDGLAIKPSVIQIHHSLLSILLTAELHIDISHQMVSKVVAHIHLFHFSILFLHLCEDFLKELIVMLLHLHITDGTAQTIGRLGSVLRITVNVQQGNSLTESWFIVQSGAAVPMATGPNFKVERTVDLVFLCSEDGRQVFSHFRFC